MISKIIEFFSKLLDVHFLYWDMSFKEFDPVVFLITIVAAVSINGMVAGVDVLSLLPFSVLEVIVVVLACLFCFAWPPFRPQFRTVAANLICLCFSLCCIALLLVLVLLGISSIDPVGPIFRDLVERIIEEFRRWPWDSAISAATTLYIVSLGIVLVNTLISVGSSGLGAAIRGRNVVPLIVAISLGWLGTTLAVGPIIAAFPE